MSLQQIIAIIIFLCTMGAIITGKVHNTVASLTGAACLVLTHILSIEDCIDAVDDAFGCCYQEFWYFRIHSDQSCKNRKRSSMANHGDLYFDHRRMFWNA